MKVQLKYIFISVLIILVASGCRNRSDSTEAQMTHDSSTIFTFDVERSEQCKPFEGEIPCMSYKNDSLSIIGRGGLIAKQGNWKYFSKGREIGTTQFEDGLPVTTNLTSGYSTEWEEFKDEYGNFRISYPKDWTFVDQKDAPFALIFVRDSTKIFTSEYNLLIMAWDEDLEKKIERENANIINEKKASILKFKKLNIPPIKEAYQRIMKSNLAGDEIISVQNIIAHETEVYIITFRCYAEHFNDNFIFFDSIIWSLRLVVYE